MATINLGNLTFTHKGDYAGGTAYVKNDVVYYATNGNSYIAKTSTTGNAPTSTAHWNLFLAGASGIWNAGLSLGSAGQAVKVNTAGNALEFGSIASKIVNVAYYQNNTNYSNSSSGSYVDATNHNITYTPASASNKLLIYFIPNVRMNSGSADVCFQYILTRTIGGTGTDIHSAGSTETYWYDSSGGQRIQHPITYVHDDTPNTTSAITYSFKFRNAHSGQTVFVSNDSSYSRWVIWEYAT